MHSFLVIVPNHAGDDLYRFTTPSRGRRDFYVRQILGSANFRTGGDVNDFLHGFLNYQIEHHLWPDLPMRAYQRAQPEVKALCAAHGVPYVQQSVWRRAWKTAQIMA
ncbi:MAG: fatty acid desaturase, partial [bacterium]